MESNKTTTRGGSLVHQQTNDDVSPAGKQNKKHTRESAQLEEVAVNKRRKINE